MKVGEYVRTKYGIKQIYEIDNNKTVWKYKFKLKKQDGDGCVNLGCFSDSDVIKSSPNIIDLIEENDLIHYEYYGIEATSNVYLEKGILILGEDEDRDEITLNDIEIKSIVTHEQFSQMEYRIEE